MRHLTAILLVRDAAPRLPAWLDDLAGLADALAVLDTGSGDGTPALLARERERGRFAAIRLSHGDLRAGFGAARQRLLAMVPPGGWVLWLDADEQLSPALRERLVAWKRLPDTGGPWGYRIPMVVVVLGRVMRCRELAGQRHLRLFRRDGARFDPAATVHEGVVPPPGAVLAGLPDPIHHHTCPTARHYLAKIDCYTALEASHRARRPWPWLLGHLLVTAPTTWWRLYIWRGCWRDGWAGLVWAALTAWSNVRRDLAALRFRMSGGRGPSGPPAGHGGR